MYYYSFSNTIKILVYIITVNYEMYYKILLYCQGSIFFLCKPRHEIDLKIKLCMIVFMIKICTSCYKSQVIHMHGMQSVT